MKCGWCASFLEGRRGTLYCSRKCRQSAFRLRRRGLDPSSAPGGGEAGLRFAYADPPYPGKARRYYRKEANFGGEVDHRELVASLVAANYAGWALSTSSEALRDVLPLCPKGARVCAWVKPIGVPAATYGMHSSWEALIVVGGRRRRPGHRDWLSAQPARRGGTLPGRKPIAFAAFLFRCLGMLPGDELVDLYPGTGIIGRAWANVGGRPAAKQLELLQSVSR